MVSKKPRQKVERRTVGLINVPDARPDDGLFNPFKAAKEAEESAAARQENTPPSAPETTTHHQLPPTSQPPPTSQVIAPARDFSRVANSIVRQAMPAGLFKGESKKTYDALYQRTRGAVVPRRVIRATQSDLMEWAGVSHNTLKAHLKHLTRVGLLVIHYVRGDNTGAEYEPVLPEEAAPPPTTTHHPQTSHPPTSSQNLAPPTSQNLVLGGGGQIAVESTISGDPKTSFKTSTERSDDDEAFAKLLAILKQTTREVTGKNPSASEAERWAEVAEVLSTEFKIAAARTTVSSAPSFFAEHLRRRLFKKDKRQLAEEAASQPARPTIPASVDVNSCPDCCGSNYYYPEGYEKGVRRCDHAKLTVDKGEEGS
jgi:hypothetical protein